MIASYVMDLIDSTKATNDDLMYLYRLFPGFCFGHGLFQVATNSLIQTLGKQSGLDFTVDTFAWDVAGKDILYLYVCAPCYFVLVLVVDALLNFPALASFVAKDRDCPDPDSEASLARDEDVEAEAARINAQVAAGAAGEEDVIRLRQLRKVYAGRGKAKRKVAVQSLSFGIPNGQSTQNPFASRSVRRTLLTQQVNPGSLYRCGRSA